MSVASDMTPEPLMLGDIAAIDAETPVRWGQVLLKTSAGVRRGPATAEVFMANDRSRFRVIDCSTGRTEFLSSLQFCKFILELRSTGRFEFERRPKRKAAPQSAAAPTTSVFNQQRRAHPRRRSSDH
ncbi:hypothetical protein [Blastochloris viridis]|uniref:Uncharacterized protein n=1 Tax=Blastochloris viridis TaxID=1079 RepID=A0A0H5BFB2_BLAVI|nr:hypothetical protein [Blastochloris viridis]ALK10268.1 hypothetical protein BVIR_2502 [Blastochloris viridis]BAR99799.1 hypothetical protein BV133_2206 [Blastochloris viridis]CUU42930.1 hypothetical protein BVIRIDIS_19460 [Blastochloris viridis]